MANRFVSKQTTRHLYNQKIMAQPTTFNIGVDFTKFETYASTQSSSATVIDLSGISGCITVPDNGTFGVSSLESTVDIGVCMTNLGNYANQENPPMFYFPNVGSFSYRNGNWFIEEISFFSTEGATPDRASVFGRDIGLRLQLMDGISSVETVDFRLHFVIQYWEGETLKSYACYIDPKLKVSQPPSTPPPAV